MRKQAQSALSTQLISRPDYKNQMILALFYGFLFLTEQVISNEWEANRRRWFGKDVNGINCSIFKEYWRHLTGDMDEIYGKTQVRYRLAVEPSRWK
jgi:hypothetical protein